MKKQLLFVVFTLLWVSTTSYGQESLTHKIIQDYDSDTQEYNDVFKEEYTYNDNGQLKETKGYYWMSIIWTPASQTQYTYDTNDNLTQTIYLSWNDATKSFMNVFRNDLSYTNNNLTSEISYNWVSVEWKQKDKTDFVYDGDNMVSFHSSEWNGTQWTADDRGVVNYEANKISEVIIEEFENNIWVLSDKNIYHRDAATGHISEFIFQTWENSAWKNDEKINYKIEANNRMTEIFSTSPDGINWVQTDKTDYDYDLSTLLSKYRSPFYVNVHLNEIGIDDMPHYNRLLTSTTSENSNDDMPSAASWEIETRSIYYYSDDTMGFNDLSASNFVNVYPNPVKNTLNIKLKDQIQADARLFDINGRLVLEQKIQALNTSLNIEALNAGIYILKIYSDNGFATKRITKN